MFIVSVVQHMKIGDLSIQQGGVPLAGTPAEEMMDVDGQDNTLLPSGTGETPVLSREEERALARDSTAGFAGELLYAAPRVQSWLTLNVIRLARLAVPTNICSIREPPGRGG